MAGVTIYLVDVLPRAGFVNSARPRVLTTDQRDRQLLRGLAQVIGRPFLQKSDRPRVDRVLAFVLDHLSANPPTGSDFLAWLDNLHAGAVGEPTWRIALAGAVPIQVWRDLVIRLVMAQRAWVSDTSPAIKASQVNDLHALWHAVRQFRRVADAAFNSDIITIAATVNPRSYFTYAVDFPSCFPGNTNLLTWGNTPSSEETKAPQEQPSREPACR
ncbi:hypothetical protein V8F06_006657 [Rhypophila decipiens]